MVCLLIILLLFSKLSYAQNCSSLTATYISTESRCAATGMIQVNASGGSGNYQYKVSGPIVSTYTSSNIISGLSAGHYLVIIEDLVTHCVYQHDSVTVSGNYTDPAFTMTATDVTCINGNDGTIANTSLQYGRAPFSYKIIAPSASSVGATNSTGNFTGLSSGQYLIQLTDSCGGIQTRGITIQNYDWLIDQYTVTKIGCNVIYVVMSLKDNKGRTTPDSVFNNFTYGVSPAPGDTSWYTASSFYYYIGTNHSVTLIAKDGCGNIKTVYWTDPNVPNVDANVALSNKTCSSFTATIIGQVNLTNPQYCLYDDNGNIISCNSTGVFNSLPYGKYCINITNTCYDTVITRCFTANRPQPSVNNNLQIVTTCIDFTVTVTGQTNLNNPQFCLYDSGNILITCNTTGSFRNLAFGSYCIKIKNDSLCYDTTITKCFTVNRPIPSAATNVSITNLACSTFTATISSLNNWNNAQFCLYTPSHVLIICNTTGVFNNLAYGSYCIEATNGAGCYDTTMIRCFTVNHPIPNVAAGVSITNRACYTFTATVKSQQNLNSPQYCLYDSTNVQVACNSNGVFNNVNYGSYCIKIKNDSTCYDTTITRCFSVYDTAKAKVKLTASKSCTGLGNTDIKVEFLNGAAAFVVNLYSASDSLIATTTTSGTYYFYGLPDLPSPQMYKVVITDICGYADSAYVSPVVSVVKPMLTRFPKCPSSTSASGSADVKVDITNNNIGGNIVPVIISKDGISISISANSGIGYQYTFLNLSPGIYIFDTYISNCNIHVFDTVEVRTYVPPGLSRSAAYQCDNNSFSVGAVANGGIAPYLFEIIGSIPSTPSIIAGPQSSPLFNINNGTIYSLIRLRVSDACANAGLHDVSVLPLANIIISATDTCFYQNITLSVDTIDNATYTWYKRIPVNDSIYIGTGPSWNIPFLLPTDTGRYICKMSVNNGCLTRLDNFHLTGYCGTVLANGITLGGNRTADANQLNWVNENPSDTKEYMLERSAVGNAGFTMVCKIQAASNPGGHYNYPDRHPLGGNNYYRLKYLLNDNSTKYSNVVVIKNSEATDISIYPNPVSSILYVSINNTAHTSYRIDIDNAIGKRVQSNIYNNVQNLKLAYPRPVGVSNGIYFLTVTNLVSHEKGTYKLVYQ